MKTPIVIAPSRLRERAAPTTGHGNEGVGNGQDAPPPGHDNNQNDGPGTEPGNPGNAHHGNPNAGVGRQWAPGMLSSWDLLEGLLQFQLDGYDPESESYEAQTARLLGNEALSLDDQIERQRRAFDSSRHVA